MCSEKKGKHWKEKKQCSKGKSLGKRKVNLPFYMVHPQNVGFKTSGFKTSGCKISETSGLQKKTSGLQNVRFTKCQVYKTSGLQNVQLQKNINKHSVLVVGGNPQVLLQPCLQAKWWLCFIFYF
jgi:hypothetical protein